MKHVRLVVNRQRTNALDFADHLKGMLAHRGLQVSDEECDLIVAVGGDGTVLEATRLGLALDRPVLGFNLGTVGFLAESEPSELERSVGDLASGRYRIERRPTLEAEVNGSRAAGVNDVVIEKIDSQRLVVLDVIVDGTAFLTYRCDGLVLATATGSTAYSFSAGGPLVDPSLEAVLVSPVAPHSLFNRTVILRAETTISVRVAAARPTRVSVDGVEIGELDEDGIAHIRRGERDIGFVRFDREAFHQRVTRKFGLE